MAGPELSAMIIQIMQEAGLTIPAAAKPVLNWLFAAALGVLLLWIIIFAGRGILGG